MVTSWLMCILSCCLIGEDTPATTVSVVGQTACVAEPCSSDRWYASVEFLWWYLKKDDVPPLVSYGPEGSSGLPGEPGVRVISSGSLISRHDRFIGVRPTVGYWFNDEQTVGLEASAMFLERDSSILHIKRVTYPLFRLYIDAESGEQASEQFAGLLPSGVVRRGSVQVYGRKEIYTQDVRGLFQLYQDETWRWYAVGGAKFIQFRNQLNVVNTGYDEPELNVLYGVEDNYYAYDRFYGGQIGIKAEAQSGPWFANCLLGCGLGANEQRLRTDAAREVRTPLTRDKRPIGLLVQYSNIIDETRVAFSAVPELQVNLGWAPTEWFRAQVGYGFTAWTNVLRAGDQVDPVVNTDQINGPDYTGPARPTVPWKESTFWAQGFSIGAEFRW